MWSVQTKAFTGSSGVVAQQLQACQVEWTKKKDGWKVIEKPGTDFSLDIDLVILATGFLHVAHEGLVKDLNLKLDSRGNIVVDNYQTSNPAVFAAGDTILGPSLVVKAIDTARKAAEAINNSFQC